VARNQKEYEALSYSHGMLKIERLILLEAVCNFLSGRTKD